MAITILSILIDGVEQLKKEPKIADIGIQASNIENKCHTCKKHKEYYTKIREFKQRRDAAREGT